MAECGGRGPGHTRHTSPQTHVGWREEEDRAAGEDLKHLYLSRGQPSSQVVATRGIAERQDGGIVEAGELLQQVPRLGLPDAEVLRAADCKTPAHNVLGHTQGVYS